MSKMLDEQCRYEKPNYLPIHYGYGLQINRIRIFDDMVILLDHLIISIQVPIRVSVVSVESEES